jgi:hypothetical protein
VSCSQSAGSCGMPWAMPCGVVYIHGWQLQAGRYQHLLRPECPWWCVGCAGKRIKCSRLDGPGVLLLGDAAHAVTPVSGPCRVCCFRTGPLVHAAADVASPADHAVSPAAHCAHTAYQRYAARRTSTRLTDTLLMYVCCQVFGQGANSALESCKVLGQVLQEAGGDVSRVPQM